MPAINWAYSDPAAVALCTSFFTSTSVDTPLMRPKSAASAESMADPSPTRESLGGRAPSENNPPPQTNSLARGILATLEWDKDGTNRKEAVVMGSCHMDGPDSAAVQSPEEMVGRFHGELMTSLPG